MNESNSFEAWVRISVRVLVSAFSLDRMRTIEVKVCNPDNCLGLLTHGENRSVTMSVQDEVGEGDWHDL